MYIKSSRIYMEDGCKSGYLRVSGGLFTEFCQHADSADELLDVGNLRVIPGIFDTHNHGTCGYTLEGSGNPEENEETIRGYLKGCASQGVTSVFATAKPELFPSLAREASQPHTAGARIRGIHSEGPWLNRVGEKGIRRPYPPTDLSFAEKMVADAGGWLKIVSLAPEIPGIRRLIDYFLAQGITVGAAHSDNQYAAAMDAYEHGISVSTHTGNVMTGMHHRDIGGLGAALTNGHVMCEVICDGLHICNDMLKIYFKLKDISHFMMISDCTAYSGAPAGEYLSKDYNEKRIVTEEGFLLSDTGRLCGSTQPVLYGIRNLTEHMQIPLETVLRMSSLNPAEFYGFGSITGSIRIGKKADFVILTDDYQVSQTYVGGQKVYDSIRDGRIFQSAFLT